MSRHRKNEDHRIATVSAALNQLTVAQLKPLAALLQARDIPTRKPELAALVGRQIAGARLRELWEGLDDIQKKAVSETLYAPDGVFNHARFKAKYGRLPNFGGHSRKDASLIALFIYNQQVIPQDLQERLRAFVTPPDPPRLKLTDELPEVVGWYEEDSEGEDFDDDWDEDDEFEDFDEDDEVAIEPATKSSGANKPILLLRRDTERAAAQDLQTVLRLIDRGKVSVSDKTFQPSANAIEEITTLLRDGDWYEPEPKKNKWDQDVGPIKAFAWPLLMQAAKLAEPQGRKLALTKAGRHALSRPAAETLRAAWQRWLKNKLIDEFRRIDEIKGQSGRGRSSFTAVGDRHALIAEAMKQCPVGAWVKFDDFTRFMRAAGFDFEVTYDPWTLYITDQQYGNLGYIGSHDWSILQGRYLLCLLFEYAATLGLIDVAYIHPSGARGDFHKMWGADELEFLSRYDGLLYFRLNPLGAYCLGLTDHYTPSRVETRAELTVLPSLLINVAGVRLSPGEALLLETWAERESDEVWRLDSDKALSAVERGHQIAELREFLQSRDEQPLPETVEGFIVTTERRARALKNTGAALLIECADAELAELITNHERTKKLCLRAGERYLVVNTDAEEQFRKAVHLLGYGMPRV
jgi:XPB/Ssl2-like helicase family protein